MKIDLVNKRFGKLTVLSQAPTRGRGVLFWLCVCECGVKKEFSGQGLRAGRSNHCGCARAKIAGAHGFRRYASTSAQARFYKSWASMKQRCLRKKDQAYALYGGRGIKVCKKWLKFEGYKEDMWDSFQEHVKEFGIKETSIDRIDSNGNYEPSNCRWATIKQQLENRRPWGKAKQSERLL